MTEQQRANYYQEHKDDAEIWEVSEGRDPPSQHKNLRLSITVRLSAERVLTTSANG